MKKFLTWCSKYLSIPTILIIGFIVYILFIQDYRVSSIYRNDVTIDSLKRAIAAEQDTLDFYRDKNVRLANRDPEIVEKIVREQFGMSLPTEEVYEIVSDD